MILLKSNLTDKFIYKRYRQKKVIVAKIVKNINNKITVNIYKNKVKKNIDQIGKNYSIICDGTDNFKQDI